MTEATATDWSGVTMTTAASNTKKPAARVAVVVVPRKVFAQCWPKPWAELEDLAARGEMGLTRLIVMVVDSPQKDTAHMREGVASDHGLRGKALLFQQGW